MIISRVEFLHRSGLDQATLDVWIEEEWLIPVSAIAEPEFSEADLARAELIHDLKHDLGVNDEGIGVVLTLLDQVHSLRNALASMLTSAQQRSIPAEDVSPANPEQNRG